MLKTLLSLNRAGLSQLNRQLKNLPPSPIRQPCGFEPIFKTYYFSLIFILLLIGKKRYHLLTISITEFSIISVFAG